MPGIQVDFTEDEYRLIPSDGPGKKRGWVRDLVRRELALIGGERTVPMDKPVDTDPEWAFRVNGGVRVGRGKSPALASIALGLTLDPTREYMSVEEATAAGWFDKSVDPMDV